MRSILFWILAFVITLASAVYQRVTGPTYPVSGAVEIDDQKVEYEFLRTHVTTDDARMEIAVPNINAQGEIKWRRYKSHDPWSSEDLLLQDNKLLITIPKQPSAGKVMYQISLYDSSGQKHELSSEPVIMRFKDPVPTAIIIPHVILIFAAMFFSTRTGIEAIARGKQLYSLTLWTTGLMFVGGLIFGPIVQKYAFDAFWTGWPVGHDLTDTKTAVAFIFWLVALVQIRRKSRGHIWAILAALVTLIIFLIPHSVLGSEIDYTTLE